MISVMDVLTIFITGFIAGGVCNYIHCLEREENRKKLAAVKNGNGTLYVRRKRAAKLLPFLYQTIGKKEYRWQEKNEQTTGAVY